MSNNDVELKIGADGSQSDQEFNKTASNAESAAKRIQEAFREASNNMSVSMSEASAKMNSEFDKVLGAVSKVRGALGLIAGALAGGHAFKEMVEESRKFTGEAVKLSKQLGITATEAGVLNIALGDAYLDADTMAAANAKLTRTLKDNEDAFGNLGVKTRDTNGDFRSTMDIMLDTNKRLLDFKEGIDRNIEGQKIYGKSWGEVAGILKLTRDGMAEASKKAEDLHLVVGEEGIKAAKEYKTAMNDVGDVMLGLKKAVGDAVMPILTKLGEWFADIGPAAVVVIKGAIGGLVAVFWGLKNAVVIAFEVINAAVIQIAEPIRAVTAAMVKLLKGDFEGAKNEITNIPKVWDKAWSDAGNNIIASITEVRDKIYNLFADPIAVKAKGEGERSEGGDKPEKKDKADKSRMAEWESELAQAKVTYQLEHDLREMTKQDEVKFWQEKLQLTKSGSQEEIAVSKKLAETQFEILKQKAAQTRALKQEEIDENKAVALDAVAMAEQSANQQLAMGQITQAQMIEMQRQFEQQRTDIQEQAQAERITALLGDPNYDPVALQKLLDEMAAIHRKHAMDVNKINNDMALNQKKEMDQMLAPITAALDKTITGMIQGTLTLQKALRNIFQSILAEFVNMAVKMGVKWVATEAMKTEATKGQTLLRTVFEKLGLVETAAAQTAAGATQMAEQKALGLSGVMSNAAIAATAAMASVAAIPLYGWAMAPAVGAETFATAMAYTPAAKQGYDIPAGVNPLTQLHEREMVLPAAQADAVRNMANGSSGGGDTHLHVHAVDGASIERLFRDHGHILAKELRRQSRNFSPVNA